MFTDQELLTRLHAAEMDESELQSIVANHFRSACSPSPSKVVFPGTTDESKIALQFQFQKGQIAAIHGGPALKEEDIVTLQSVIESELSPAPLQVATVVLFASLPVTGAFRFRDIVQILPVPPEAPRPSALLADHPFLLQFQYKPSHSALLRAARRMAHARVLQLLLSVLLEGGIRSLNSSVTLHWVIEPFNPDRPAPPRSMFCQEMYTFEGLAKLAENESFCDITSIEPLALIDPVQYYTRSAVQLGQSMSGPASLNDLLGRFFSASGEDQERFIRSSYWFSHAQTVYLQSRSASFTSLISAIEALMPYEQKVVECPMCKRAIGKGATRRLNEFLDQYAPTNPRFQASRVALYYEFRSQLAHGGALSYLDRNVLTLGLGGRRREEQDWLDEVRQLVKIVLINWLHSRSSLLIPTKGRSLGRFAFGT